MTRIPHRCALRLGLTLQFVRNRTSTRASLSPSFKKHYRW